MKTIIITDQKGWDKLPKTSKEYRAIYIKDTTELVIVRGALGNSTVEAWGNSTVEALGNSTVKAWGNSTVKALGNSTVEAWGNSTVEAWGNSTVEAWGNSTVKAFATACVHLMSPWSQVALFGFAVGFLMVKAVMTKKSKTATVIKPEYKDGNQGWCDREGIDYKANIIVYKKVSKDFLTQEGTKNETKWELGTTVTHPKWSPKDEECGEGKFHACSRTHFCDEFRSLPEDKYIAIEVKKEDLYAWTDSPSYPHKIAFREGKVLHEVDKNGKKI